MDPTEFLTMLQIVDLTRDQPKLKVVHDFMLEKCESHVKEIEEALGALRKEEADKKAKVEEEAKKAKEAEAKKEAPAPTPAPKTAEEDRPSAQYRRT